MRSESQPLLGDKKKDRPGSAQASSTPLNVPDAGAASGGFVPVVPDPSLLQSPSQQQQQQQSPYPHPRRSSVGNVLDFSQGPAPGAVMHRASFLGAMSLPASPPFEAGPVMHFADGDRGDDGQAERGGSGRGSEMLHASPVSTFGHAHTHSHPHSSNQDDDVGLLHRSTTVGPGSYIPASAHHMMEMMTTPGRGGGGGGLGSVAEDGGGGRGGGGGGDNGGGNNSTSSNSLNRGRPEPHIEEAMFDLDPDFDLSAPHLMKMFNMLDRDHNGEGGGRGREGGREQGGKGFI